MQVFAFLFHFCLQLSKLHSSSCPAFLLKQTASCERQDSLTGGSSVGAACAQLSIATCHEGEFCALQHWLVVKLKN